MNLLAKLALADLRRHPARLCVTSLATVAAACVVVWVVSGYDALEAQFDDSAERTLGRYDVLILPGPGRDVSLEADLIAELQQDPAVAEINPIQQVRARITRLDGFAGMRFAGVPPAGGQPSPTASPPGSAAPGMRGRPAPGAGAAGPLPGARGGAGPGAAGPRSPGGPGGGRPGFRFGGPALVGTDATEAPLEMVAGRWLAPQPAGQAEAVISREAAERLEVGLGDELRVFARAGEFQVRLVGVIEQATVQAELGRHGRAMAGPPTGPAVSALYVRMAVAAEVNGAVNRISHAYVRLRHGTDLGAFGSRWRTRLARCTPPAELVNAADVRAGMEESRLTGSARKQAYSATGMSLLAAMFIIFTTLSMGVQERLRQLAILRAVALTRSQVASLIAFESLVFALIGWVGGLAAGWGLLKVMAATQPTLFRGGAALGLWCVLLTGAAAVGGALAAAVFPAWHATRISPLDAVAPAHSQPARPLPCLGVAAGVILVGVPPLLLYVVPMPDEARYAIYAAVGCTCMAAGFLLLTPLAITTAERLCGPLLARALRLNPHLLRSQLSSNLWRTLGTTVALTVGLGLYVATVIWGYSMLQPFVPGDWVPDVLLAFQSGGLPPAAIPAVQQSHGVKPGRCLPLAVEQPCLAQDITGSEERVTVARQDNVVLIGLDPHTGLGGPDPLLRVRFVQGTADEAARRLAQGRHCVVPDHFAKATGLGLGERFSMVPPDAPEAPVEYTIAGVVALPGWHWMTKFSGLRRRSPRAAAMVFAAYEDVCRDFHIEQVNFFWLEKDPAVQIADLGAALQPLADRYLGAAQPVNDQGTWTVGASMFGSSLRVSTRDEVRRRVAVRAEGMIWGMCQLPLVTLLIASLAVVNTVMASVRARRWEMGILRAVGTTRSALVRLVLAEAILIGLAACLLSLAFGITAGWCGTGVSQYVSFFGGLETPLVIPWTRISLSFAGTLVLCLAAALWPALATGRAEPLQLLQSGRGSM